MTTMKLACGVMAAAARPPTKIYELCTTANPNQTFSPFCWASRISLIHKKLPYTTTPWRITEKDSIAFSGQGLVPVIIDGDKWVNDSFAIAQYLEDTYPEAPSLFGGPGGQAGARFMVSYVRRHVYPIMFPLMVLPICNALAGTDQEYYRSTREARVQKRLEEVLPDSEQPAQIEKWRESLQPFREALAEQPFLGGDSPLYSDIVLFSNLLWAKAIIPRDWLEPGDALYPWRARMFAAYPNLEAVWAH